MTNKVAIVKATQGSELIILHDDHTIRRVSVESGRDADQELAWYWDPEEQTIVAYDYSKTARDNPDISFCWKNWPSIDKAYVDYVKTRLEES